MMAVNRVATFIENLRDLQLLEAGRLDDVARLPQARGEDPMPLARELIQRGLLTPFQVNSLAKGTGKELVVGPYRLLDRLGEGGMGTVYKACHTAMGRIVALKVIKKNKLSNPLAIKRFLQEVQNAGKLVHPNIVMAFDAGQVGDTHYFAMEYIEGVDLAKLVRMSGPLPVLEACDYIRQAAAGLQHAHERGMVHRDIKPNNLIVARSPGSQGAGLGAMGAGQGGNGPASTTNMVPRAVVKILDMGLARIHGDEGAALTKIGAVIGTPEFLAPEQAKNSHAVDIRSDLYSLGCTFYYLLAGKVPIRGLTVAETLVKHQIEEPPPLDMVRPDMPPQLWLVVKKLMAKKAEDRYQTPADLILALSPFNRRGAVPASAPKLPVAPLMPAGAPERKVSPSTVDMFADMTNTAAPSSRWASKRRRRRTVQLALASVVLAAAVGAGLVFWPDLQKGASGLLAGNGRSTAGAVAKASGPVVVPGVPDTEPKGGDPKGDPIPDPQPDPKPDPKPDPGPETKTDPKPDPKPEPKPDPKPDPKPEPKPDPKPDPKPEPAPTEPGLGKAPPKKPAVPEPAKQAEAEKLIKENFKAEYAKKKPAELAEFAVKLLQEGIDTKDNPAARYVLFREARDVAVQGSDLETALRAIDEMDKAYAISATTMKIDALDKAGRVPGISAPVIRGILENALGLADELIEADEYDAALNALSVARGAALRTSNLVANQISLRSREVAEMQKEYGAARAAADTLVKLGMPDDPDANYRWGRFLALYKGAWSNGLPHLAQGSDAKWKALAEKEAKATDSAARLELGNTYWDMAEAEKSLVPKKQLYIHAKDCYDKAQGELSGLSKTTVERRLKTIESMLAKDQIVLTDKPTTPGTLTPKPQQSYDKFMLAGQTAYQQGRFKDAVDAYTAALQARPEDARAQQYLRRAKYAMHMANGQTAIAQRDYRTARDEFVAALDEVPGDTAAMAALSQLRSRMGFGKFNKFNNNNNN
jgi:serine/threonine protein kinase